MSGVRTSTVCMWGLMCQSLILFFLQWSSSISLRWTESSLHRLWFKVALLHLCLVIYTATGDLRFIKQPVWQIKHSRFQKAGFVWISDIFYTIVQKLDKKSCFWTLALSVIYEKIWSILENVIQILTSGIPGFGQIQILMYSERLKSDCLDFIRISVFLDLVRLWNSSDFRQCLKSEWFSSDFRRLVDRLDQLNVGISNVYTIRIRMIVRTEWPECLKSELFGKVPKSERSDFRRIMYSDSPKTRYF